MSALGDDLDGAPPDEPATKKPRTESHIVVASTGKTDSEIVLAAGGTRILGSGAGWGGAG